MTIINLEKRNLQANLPISDANVPNFGEYSTFKVEVICIWKEIILFFSFLGIPFTKIFNRKDDNEGLAYGMK